jgi:hypothetical protein
VNTGGFLSGPYNRPYNGIFMSSERPLIATIYRSSSRAIQALELLLASFGSRKLTTRTTGSDAPREAVDRRKRS